MPVWTNGDLTVFHGTDSAAIGLGSPPPGLASLPQPAAMTVDLSKCKRLTDFGQGFYTTTSLHQAKQWANARLRRVLAPGPTTQFAVVISFSINRDELGDLETLGFVRGTLDYWDFMQDCRAGFPPHQRASPRNAAYDVVYGPVSLWQQILLIQDCDQISFHTDRAIQLLNANGPTLVACASSAGGLF